MRLRVLALLLMTAPLCAAAQDAQNAQDAAPTLHVQVRLVSVYVSVTDAQGAPVADLEKRNFALSEDGAPQTISIFEKQTNVPLSVVLAIDTSGSTRKDEGAEKRAASGFAHDLLGPVDRLALFSFASEVHEVVPFTSDLRSIDHGLGDLGHGPATAFYNAILLASQTLAPQQGRKVLVVISDGDDTASDTTYRQAVDAAQRGDVMIYSLIDVPIEADAGRSTAGEHAMITLSQETGGRSFYVNQGGLTQALRQVSDALRTQYLLGFYPRAAAKPTDPLAQPDSFRTLRVVLRDTPPGAEDTAHYRSGYFRAPGH